MHTGLPGGQGRGEGVDYGLGEERATKKKQGVYHTELGTSRCLTIAVSDFSGPESFVIVEHNFQGGHESKESHLSGK